MLDEKCFFDEPVKNNLRTCKVFEKVKQLKQMITQVIVCETIVILKTIIR